MASFEPITAKDFQSNNNSVPPTQIEVLFTKTHSLTHRPSQYIPHKEDWCWIMFGGLVLYSLHPGLREALWWEYLTLVHYIFEAATPGGVPQTLNHHCYFTIPHIGLHQLQLPNPFPYDLRELSSNPLVAYAPKAIMLKCIILQSTDYN